ncbi:MAG: isoleucyl-tRNA synthetase [Microgenomates group bacterium Gr01-1014_16]|nr:MAG: isoleucyl-tRNA synthetase [Microgenomates group bacterium Gr01-1014_16]
MKDRYHQHLEDEPNKEQKKLSEEITIINPPLFSHDGHLSAGQLVSITLVDVTYRYFRDKAKVTNYASRAYNVQGKPAESEETSNTDLITFVKDANVRTSKLAEQIEQEKEKLGVLGSGFEFVDSSKSSQATAQKRFIDLCEKGLIFRNGRRFFLNSDLAVKTHDMTKVIETIEFHPKNLKNTINQLLNDAVTPIELTKDRLFATPLPIHVCGKCDVDFMSSDVSFPIDPRVNPAECLNCHHISVNDPRDTLAPLFDLTQQGHYLSPDHSGTVVQICGRNVLTKYIFFSLLINTALDGRPPFDVLITHGFLNDQNGKRMAKWNENMVFVNELLNQFHPDAIRFSILKTLSLNDNSSNFDQRQLEYGQKFIYKIGNLRKLFKLNNINLAETPLDEAFFSKYQRLMERFDYKLAFTLTEKYLSTISSDVARGRESGMVDMQDKSIRYKTAILALQPFLPNITGQSIAELF